MPYDPRTEGELFRGSHYNLAARRVVAQFERVDGRGRRARGSIYIRDPQSNDYVRLETPDDETSYDSLIVARSAPLAFFNVMRVRPDGGGSWVTVGCVNLETSTITHPFTKAELDAFAKTTYPCPAGPWVSDLTRASDDGTTVTCVVGLPEPKSNGGVHMNYSFFDLTVQTKELTQLAAFHQGPYFES